MHSPGFADSHVHMAEEGFGEGYLDLDEAGLLMTCTARPDEWGIQQRIDDPRAVRSYGVHPWHAGLWNPDAEEALLRLMDGGDHIGEIGLDSKRGPVGDQMRAFSEQMGIASEYDRIATVHMVGAEKEVLDALRAMRLRPRVILHSYGSESYVRPFAELGCFFSVSPRLLSRSEVRIRRLLEAVPRDRLLLESDAPNSGRGFTGMRAFASAVAGTMGWGTGPLMDGCRDNLEALLG